jgi:hypothetical protein
VFLAIHIQLKTQNICSLREEGEVVEVEEEAVEEVGEAEEEEDVFCRTIVQSRDTSTM